MEVTFNVRWKLLTPVLILLGDRSLSKVFFNCFWILYVPWLNSTYSYWILPLSIGLEVTLSKTWGFIAMLIWGKIKPCVKNWCGKLFKDLLTSKIFSKQISSWTIKMDLQPMKFLIFHISKQLRTWISLFGSHIGKYFFKSNLFY